MQNLDQQMSYATSEHAALVAHLCMDNMVNKVSWANTRFTLWEIVYA